MKYWGNISVQVGEEVSGIMVTSADRHFQACLAHCAVEPLKRPPHLHLVQR